MRSLIGPIHLLLILNLTACTDSSMIGIEHGSIATVTYCGEMSPLWTPGYNNIVSYFKFDDTVAANDRSVAAAAVGPAASVVSLDGMNVNYVAGKINNAIDLDGFGHYVAMAGSPMTSSDNFTISMWVKTNSVGLFPALYLSDMDGIPLTPSGIGIEGGTFRLLYRDRSMVQSSPIVLGVWTHVLVTVTNRVTYNMYIDGVLDNNAAVGGDWDTSNTTIGLGWGGETFNGLVDDVAVFDTALDQTDVTTLYDNQVDCR